MLHNAITLPNYYKFIEGAPFYCLPLVKFFDRWTNFVYININMFNLEVSFRVY